MTDAYLSVNGVLASTATLRASRRRWILDVDFDGSGTPTGAAVAKIGTLELVGTFVPEFTGILRGRVKARITAGANGWGTTVPARSYHDDGGVRRADVLQALARDAGETIETTGDSTRLAVDLFRLEEPASAALTAFLRGEAWRVDFDGLTRYGARPAAALGIGAELLDVDVRSGLLTFAAPDPSHVPIGAVVSDPRLGAALTIRSFDVDVTAGSSRIVAWGVAS